MLLKIINCLLLYDSNLPKLKNNIQLEISLIKKVISKLLQTSLEAITLSNKLLNNEDTKEIIENSIKMLIALIFKDFEILQHFLNYSYLPNWLESTLLQSIEQKIRKDISKFIILLCETVTKMEEYNKKLIEPLHSSFFSILLTFLSKIEEYPKTCEAYFETLNYLFKKYNFTQKNLNNLNWNQLLYQIFSQIKNHNVFEVNNQNESDR